LVKGFFLVLIALEHFLGLIHVFLSDLLWGANGCVGNASWLLALVLLPLVHDECLDAFVERFFVHGLTLVLVGK
jgi:uncharacterized membrane protein